MQLGRLIINIYIVAHNLILQGVSMSEVASSARILLLFSTMFVVFIIIGFAVGSIFFNNWVVGAIFFLIIAAIMNVISYFFSSKIVLWSYKAKIVNESESPRLYRTVRAVSQLANLPMPKVAMIPTQTPNAFATGRNKDHATVAATEGLLRTVG